MTIEQTPEQRARVEEFQRKHRIVLLTLLFTDVVGSTRLKQLLGERAAIELVERHHALLRAILARFADAEEIDTAGDSFFMVFAKPSDAVQFALLAQRAVRDLARETGQPVLDRIGIHVGEVFIQDRGSERRNLFGIQIDSTARIMSLGNADQILLSRFAFDNARLVLRGFEIGSVGELSWLNHGYYELKGVEEPVEVCEVGETGLAVLTPPGDSEKAHRFHATDAEPVLGWRPAAGLIVPETRWKLERPLGQGGFGEVWLAQHETLKQRRVLKFCFKAERARALKREATLFRVLRERFGEHPNIVAIHDVFFDAPPFYLVTDYVDGPSLDHWTGTHATLAETPLEQRLELVAQIADALQAAHDSGIIHRDVKPSNVLIADPASATPRAKLVDFGIGQVVNAEALAGVTRLGFTQTMFSTGSGSGTPLYQAPELLAGQPATIRSDLYSLGVLLRQVVICDFTQPLTTDWADQVSDPLLREDIRQCIAGDPQKRFAAAAELATRLRQLDARRHVAEQEKERTEEIARRAYRRGLVRATSAAVILVGIVASLALYAWHAAQLAERHARAEAEQRLRAEAQSRRAEQQAQVASSERNRAEQQRILAEELQKTGQRQLWQASRSDESTAEEEFKAGRWRRGLAFLGRALQMDPANQEAAMRLWSALVYGRGDRGDLPDFALPNRDFFHPAILSRDGQWVATFLESNSVRLWEVATGRPMGEVLGHEGDIKTLAFSPDSRCILTGGTDADACLWAVPSGRKMEPSMKTLGPVTLGLFSPDGKHILTISDRKSVTLWDRETAKQIWHTTLPPVPSFDDPHAAFSPIGGRIVVILGWTICFIDPANGQLVVGRVKVPDGYGSFSFALNPKEETMLTYDSKSLLFWDMVTGDSKGKAINLADIYSAEFSPDGDKVLTASADGSARLWDVSSGQATSEPFKHDGRVFEARFRFDGKKLATGSEDRTARIWEPTSGDQVFLPLRHQGTVRSVDFSSDGHTVLTSCDDLTASIWRSALGETPPPRLIFSDGYSKVAFSPDSRYFATGVPGSEYFIPAGRKPVQVWETSTGHPTSLFPDTIIDVWLSATPRSRAQKQKNTEQILSPDGRLLAVTDRLSFVQVWSASKEHPVSERFQLESGFNEDMEFSPDSRNLVFANGKSVRLWAIGWPGPPAAKWIDDLVSACGGLRFNESGELIELSNAERIKLRESLRALRPDEAGSQIPDAEWARLVKWLLKSPVERSIIP